MKKVALPFAIVSLVFSLVLIFFEWQTVSGMTVVAELIIIPMSVKKVAKGEYGVRLCPGRIVGDEGPGLYQS